MMGFDIGSVLGAAVSGVFDTFNGYLGNYYNKKAAKKANEWDLHMWNLQNEYNHPTQQMARLREANLNPNLVYGSGATTLAASTHGAHKADLRSPLSNIDLLGAVNAYQDIRQKDAMTENIKAQAMKSAADALVAIKDYDTYNKTGAHPSREVSKQFTNIILDGVRRYAGPITDAAGDMYTGISKWWNRGPDTTNSGERIERIK